MVEPRRKIIDRLGGPTQVARALDIDRTTVYKWLQDGKDIPYWYRKPLIAYAAKQGIKLRPVDFAVRGK